MLPAFFLFALLASPFGAALARWHKEGNQEGHQEGDHGSDQEGDHGSHQEGHQGMHQESGSDGSDKNYNSVEWVNLPDWFRKAVGDEGISGGFEEDPMDYLLKHFDSMAILRSGSHSAPLVHCGEGFILTFDNATYVVPNLAHCKPSCDSQESCEAVVAFYNATTPEVPKQIRLIVEPKSAQQSLTAAMPNSVTVYVDDMFYLDFEKNSLTEAGSAYPATGQ